MQSFKYRAIDNNGQSIKGRIEASTEVQAKQLLKNKQLIILEINKCAGHFLERLRQPSIQDICLFTRQLATLLAAGIHLTDALAGVAAEESSHAMQGIERTQLSHFPCLLYGCFQRIPLLWCEYCH